MSLSICGGFKHDEIVFDGRYCPLCTALEEIDKLKDELGGLTDEIGELNDKIDVLNTEIATRENA